MKTIHTTWLKISLILSISILSSTLIASNELSGKAESFKLMSNDNTIKTLEDYHGQVVLLNFWASWCAPCRAEMPALEDLHLRYKDKGFTVLGINIDEEKSHALNQLKKTPVTFPVLFDPENKISERYKVEAMPSTFMIDRSGQLRYLHKGYKSGYELEYEKQISQLIRERKSKKKKK